MAEKSATVAATMAVCPTSPSDWAGVFEHGHDQPQRRRRQRDRQQQRATHPADGVKAKADRHTEGESDQIAEQRQPQQPTAQAMRVDLQPGQEQQEGQPDEPEDLHGQIDLHPAQHRRAEHDAGDNLEDDGRQSQSWREAERQRSCGGDEADDEQVEE